MTDQRRRDLAKIHLAKKQLDIDDDNYRDILWTIARVRSAADLDMHGRMKVLHHFRALGFRPKKAGKTSFPGRPHNVDSDDQLRKIEALLTDMKLSWSYADALASHMFSIQKVAWVRKAEQLQAIITALVKKQQKAKQNNAL